MNRRLLTILLSAFVIAALCSYVVYKMVGSRITAAHQVTSTHVIAAAANIKLGTVLKNVDLTTVEIAGPLPKGVFTKPEEVIGRGVVSDLYQGEPIVDYRLAPPGSGGGLAATIRQGMRACAVKVDDVVGVAGFVTPGQRVDVLISGNPPGPATATEGTKVKTLLQNIEVLSAGTDIEKSPDGKPVQVQVVNLLVTPEQAQVLSLASNQTKIQLILRNPLDTQTADIQGSAMSNLFADKTAPVHHSAPAVTVVRQTAPQVFSIEVINGSKRSQEKFASPEVKQ